MSHFFPLTLSANGPRKQFLTSQGLRTVFKADLLGRSCLALPEKLDTDVLRTTEAILCAGWSKRTDLPNVLYVHCACFTDFVFTVLVNIFMRKTHNHFWSAISVHCTHTASSMSDSSLFNHHYMTY